MTVPPRRGIAALAILLATSPAASQTIGGRVLDASTGAPVVGADIVLLDSAGARHAAAVSDSAGTFVLAAPPAGGAYVLRAARLGYDTLTTRPIEVVHGEEVDIELRLGVLAVPLEPLTVIERRRDEDLRARDLREHYERVERYRHRGPSTILDREELERMRGVDLGTVLERHAPPFRVGARRCTPVTFLNGVRVKVLPTDLPADAIEGVEFYRGTGEARFRDREACGVVLVWTRPIEEGYARPFRWRTLFATIGAAVLLLLLLTR